MTSGISAPSPISSSPKRPVIWVVNQFDALPGEGFKLNRYPRFATALADQGGNVTWISSTFAHYTYRQRKLSQEILDNLPYRIVLVPTHDYAPGISLSRFRNHREFAKGFKSWALENGREPPDMIIVSLPTIEGVISAHQVAKGLGARIVVDVRDPWPDPIERLVPRPMKWPIKLITRPLRYRVGRLLRKADAIVAVSDTFMEWARRRAGGFDGPMHVTPLGTDLPDVESLKEAQDRLQDSPSLRITYVGSLGLSFDWKTLAQAIPIVVDAQPEARFLIMGTGKYLPDVQRSLDSSPLLKDVVELTGPMPYGEVMKRLASSDVGLHSFVPGVTATITNKVVDYVVAGLPFVNSLEGEVATLVAEKRVGVNYEAGNSGELAKAILAICHDADERNEMRKRALALASRFDAQIIYPEVVRYLFEKVLDISAARVN